MPGPNVVGGTVRCGRCGAAVPVSRADLVADGYRCLSCSTDDKIEAMGMEDRRDAARDHFIKEIRIVVTAALLFGALVVALEGRGRWIAGGLLAVTLAVGGISVRRLWRD